MQRRTQRTPKSKRRCVMLDFLTNPIYAVLFGSVIVFGGAAVLALAWAVRDGQFQNFDRGARSIFDPAEPIGEITDQFPEKHDDGARSASKGERDPLLALRAREESFLELD